MLPSQPAKPNTNKMIGTDDGAKPMLCVRNGDTKV
jgi:hypothetical protein